MRNLSLIQFVLFGLTLLAICTNQQVQVAAQQKQEVQSSNQPENNQTSDAERGLLGKVVLEYVNLARNNELSKLKKLVTRTPQSYWDYGTKKTLEMFPEMREEQNKNINSPPTVSLSMKPFEDIMYEEVLKKLPKFLYQKKEMVNKIENAFVKGNEARVRVLFKTRSRVLATDDSIDFYLFKDTNEKWKIFHWEFSIMNPNETYPM